MSRTARSLTGRTISGTQCGTATRSFGTTRSRAGRPLSPCWAGSACLPSCPNHLSFGPRWLPAALVGALLIPTVFTHMRGHHDINRILGMSVAAVETFFMLASLFLLVGPLLFPGMEMHRETPTRLLISAASLWLTNVLVFALWYWHLDAGGPNQRDLRPGHCHGSFLFPQMR